MKKSHRNCKLEANAYICKQIKGEWNANPKNKIACNPTRSMWIDNIHLEVGNTKIRRFYRQQHGGALNDTEV